MQEKAFSLLNHPFFSLVSFSNSALNFCQFPSSSVFKVRLVFTSVGFIGSPASFVQTLLFLPFVSFVVECFKHSRLDSSSCVWLWSLAKVRVRGRASVSLTNVWIKLCTSSCELMTSADSKNLKV